MLIFCRLYKGPKIKVYSKEHGSNSFISSVPRALLTHFAPNLAQLYEPSKEAQIVVFQQTYHKASTWILTWMLNGGKESIRIPGTNIRKPSTDEILARLEVVLYLGIKGKLQVDLIKQLEFLWGSVPSSFGECVQRVYTSPSPTTELRTVIVDAIIDSVFTGGIAIPSVCFNKHGDAHDKLRLDLLSKLETPSVVDRISTLHKTAPLSTNQIHFIYLFTKQESSLRQMLAKEVLLHIPKMKRDDELAYRRYAQMNIEFMEDMRTAFHADKPNPAMDFKAVQQRIVVNIPKSVQTAKTMEKPKLVAQHKAVEHRETTDYSKAAIIPESAEIAKVAEKTKVTSQAKAAEKPQATEKAKSIGKFTIVQNPETFPSLKPVQAPIAVQKPKAVSKAVGIPKVTETSKVIEQPKTVSKAMKVPKVTETSKLTEQPKAVSKVVRIPMATKTSKVTEQPKAIHQPITAHTVKPTAAQILTAPQPLKVTIPIVPQRSASPLTKPSPPSVPASPPPRPNQFYLNPHKNMHQATRKKARRNAAKEAALKEASKAKPKPAPVFTPKGNENENENVGSGTGSLPVTALGSKVETKGSSRTNAKGPKGPKTEEEVKHVKFALVALATVKTIPVPTPNGARAATLPPKPLQPHPATATATAKQGKRTLRKAAQKAATEASTNTRAQRQTVTVGGEQNQNPYGALEGSVDC